MNKENYINNMDILTNEIKKYMESKLDADIKVEYEDNLFEERIIINAFFDNYRICNFISGHIIYELIKMISCGKHIDRNLELILNNVIREFRDIFLRDKFYKNN